MNFQIISETGHKFAGDSFFYGQELNATPTGPQRQTVRETCSATQKNEKKNHVFSILKKIHITDMSTCRFSQSYV